MPRRSRLSAGPALMLTTPNVDDVEWARAHASDLAAASVSEEAAPADEGGAEASVEEEAANVEAPVSEPQPVATPAQLRMQELEKQNARMRSELEAARQKFIIDQERTRMELELEKERLKVQRLALELDLERQRQLTPSAPASSDTTPAPAPVSTNSGIVRQNRGPPPPPVPIPAGMSKKAAARQTQLPATPQPQPAVAASASQPSVRVKPAPVNKVVDRGVPQKAAAVYKGAQPREHVSTDAAALYASEARFVRSPDAAGSDRREQRDRALPESAAFGIGLGSRPMPYNPSVQQRAVGGLF